MTGSYYDKYQKLKSSKLYEALNIMPKAAVHHLHLTAASPIDYLVKLTYYDYVYYNQRLKQFKVTKDPAYVPEGFIQVNILRKYWETAKLFDASLKETILLTKNDQDGKESHGIWDSF